MSATTPLPAGYAPFDELILCSNIFRDVKIPIGINGQPLVLIGQGALPQVWLAAPSQPSASTWIYVVKESRTASSGIGIDWSQSDRTLTIKVVSLPILTVKMESLQRAIVTLLNLRPLGLNVVGSSNGLMIGTNQFTQNTISGAQVGLNLSVPGAQLLVT